MLGRLEGDPVFVDKNNHFKTQKSFPNHKTNFSLYPQQNKPQPQTQKFVHITVLQNQRSKKYFYKISY